MGVQISRVALVAKARNAPACNAANASTPVRIMVTRVFIAFNSNSGDSNACRQFLLQKQYFRPLRSAGKTVALSTIIPQVGSLASRLVLVDTAVTPAGV